jgi:hypothetical protein
VRPGARALTQIEDTTLLASYDHATEQIFRAKLRLNLNGFRSSEGMNSSAPPGPDLGYTIPQ